MKVLVTGGAGFIGSHIVDALIDGGHSVVVLDHQKEDRPRHLNASATYKQYDLSDERVQTLFRDESFDGVCHLAAQISVTKSVNDPVHDAERNILDAISLLELARKHGTKRFVFASSGGAIYGDHPERPTGLLTDAKPISPYGVSKQAFERYLHAQKDVQAVTLRMSNVYGPRQASKGESAVVATFIDRLLEGEPVQIFGDGHSTRDYLYVHDAVEAFVQALEGEAEGIVNVASGEETSLLRLWETLLSVHGKQHPMKHAPARRGEVKRSVLDPSSAHEVLGWAPKTSLEKGLRETHTWFTDAYGTDSSE